MLSSSSLHSQDSITSGSSSFRSHSQRRVTFEHVNVIESGLEWWDEESCADSEPLAVALSEKEERRAFLLATHEEEVRRYRHSAPELQVWREDRMRQLWVSLSVPKNVDSSRAWSPVPIAFAEGSTTRWLHVYDERFVRVPRVPVLMLTFHSLLFVLV